MMYTVEENWLEIDVENGFFLLSSNQIKYEFCVRACVNVMGRIRFDFIFIRKPNEMKSGPLDKE